jgi:meso-butanediol dehydrogenase/(S,S)-butanediol dehydrogenase/diacetyl reductase
MGNRHGAERVALITGGGTGIGAATARRLVADGGSVVLVGRRPEPIAALARELGRRASHVPADATDGPAMEAAVAHALERHGRLDTVVANAGGAGGGLVTGIDDQAWRAAMSANLDSAFVTARAAMTALIASRGALVIVSSLAGLFAPPALVGYVTAKHALIGFTKALARDHGRDGVRVTALCPGWVRTPMADAEMDELAALHHLADREAAYALATAHVPLGRPATPEDCAGVIAFLAGPDAAMISGTVITVDGGASAVDLPTISFEPPRA